MIPWWWVLAGLWVGASAGFLIAGLFSDTENCRSYIDGTCGCHGKGCDRSHCFEPPVGRE